MPGIGFDGLKGYGCVHKARESIALGVATERFGATFFGNGTTTGGVIEHPGELSQPARENIRASWNEIHKGLEHAHRIAILEEGMKYVKTSVSPEDSQFLQTRQFQIVEIARWFNLPPHLLRDLTHATFSNIEHQGAEFLTYSLRPWLVRWEMELRRKLLSDAEKKTRRFEFDVSVLLRGDTLARYQAYQIGRNMGVLSTDDIRRKERMTPLGKAAGGDLYLAPVNYQSLQALASG